MRLLFTNVQLDHRTGTEIVVRDLAIGMRQRGHEVAVYTPHPGAIAGELIERGVPVVDRIENVPFAPDWMLDVHQEVPAGLSVYWWYGLKRSSTSNTWRALHLRQTNCPSTAPSASVGNTTPSFS